MTTDLSKKLIRTISSICILGTLTAAAAFAAGDPSISIDKELFSQAAISPAKLDEIYASQPAANPSSPSLTEQTGADAQAVSAADASVSTDDAAPAAKSTHLYLRLLAGQRCQHPAQSVRHHRCHIGKHVCTCHGIRRALRRRH